MGGGNTQEETPDERVDTAVRDFAAELEDRLRARVATFRDIGTPVALANATGVEDALSVLTQVLEED